METNLVKKVKVHGLRLITQDLKTAYFTCKQYNIMFADFSVNIMVNVNKVLFKWQTSHESNSKNTDESEFTIVAPVA